jgi:hypothetical protein
MVAEINIKKFVGICRLDQTETDFNPLNSELSPICHLLTLLGAHHILHVSRVRVKTVGEKGFGYRQYKNGRVILTYLKGKVDRWKNKYFTRDQLENTNKS